MVKSFYASVVLVGAVALTGCTDSSSDGLIEGFDPPPVPAGYKRYVMPDLMVQPGQDIMLCQWIDVPSDKDMDVLDVTGAQTIAGHHAVVYSTSINEPVGTSRECTTEDMLSVDFLGGIGGEGTSGTATKLPDGVVFRARKGRALMANVHYYNVTDEVQHVQSVLDLKLAAPSAENKAAGITGINLGDINIPAGAASYAVDAYCTWPQESTVIMWSNHMHQHGSSIYTEIKRTSGEIVPLVSDETWVYEAAFNPAWKYWDLDAPMMLHAGDQLHVHCEWNNPTDHALLFPDEMCVGLGFYLESSEQAVCGGEPST